MKTDSNIEPLLKIRASLHNYLVANEKIFDSCVGIRVLLNSILEEIDRVSEKHDYLVEKSTKHVAEDEQAYVALDIAVVLGAIEIWIGSADAVEKGMPEMFLSNILFHLEDDLDFELVHKMLSMSKAGGMKGQNSWDIFDILSRAKDGH